MNANRFDTVARVFANRRMTRRLALSQAGAAAVGVGATAIGFENARAQSATPVTDTDTAAPKEFLFVQSFESGTLEPLSAASAATPAAGGAEYTLTLSQGLGQTIFFSDRPERVVGTVPTPRFLDALGFTPENPPNAALVASTGNENEEILVVELFNPSYDEALKTVTYGVRILDDFDRVDMTFTQDVSTEPKAATSYGVSNLFVDDCDSGYIRCFNDMLQTKTLGDIAVDRCWVWSELCCFPCSTGNDFDKMAAICESVYGDQCDPNTGCSAGNLGGCA
jgi:hypothetical protein